MAFYTDFQHKIYFFVNKKPLTASNNVYFSTYLTFF